MAGQIGISLVVLGIAAYLGAQVSELRRPEKHLVLLTAVVADSRRRHLAGAQRTLPAAGTVLDRRRLGHSVFSVLGDLQP